MVTELSDQLEQLQNQIALLGQVQFPELKAAGLVVTPMEFHVAEANGGRLVSASHPSENRKDPFLDVATTTIPTVTLADGHSFELKYHDLVPPLADEVFSELLESIKARGMIVPVLVNRLSEVIDGQHRLKVAKALGKTSTDIPIETWIGEPDDERALAIDLNLKRRHLGPEDRRRLVGKLKAGGLSNRAIAAQIGVDESTVRRDVERSGAAPAAPEQGVEVKTPALEVKTKGIDGRSYPSETLPATAINRRRAQAGALQDAGKSVREIAKELDVSVGTVSADLQLRAKTAEEESGEEWLARQQARISNLTSGEPEPEEAMLCDVCEEPCGDRTFREGSWIGECCSTAEPESTPEHTEVTKPVTSAKKSTAPKVASKKKRLAPESTPLERALDRKHGTGIPAAKPRAKTSRREQHPFHDLDLKNWKDVDLPFGSMLHFGPRAKGEGRSGDYHGNFIPQVPDFSMRRYTKKGDLVLDMFTGSGTTMVEAVRLGRDFIGLDLQSKMVERCTSLFETLPNPHGVTAKLTSMDSASDEARDWVHQVAREAGKEHVDHVILHPPYWNIINFSEDKRCLSREPNLAAFSAAMGLIAQNTFGLLAPGRWATLTISDITVDGALIDLAGDCQREFESWGFVTKAKFVKDVSGNEKGKGKDTNLWRYRALDQGFAVFEHEYILAFQKPLEKGR